MTSEAVALPAELFAVTTSVKSLLLETLKLPAADAFNVERSVKVKLLTGVPLEVAESEVTSALALVPVKLNGINMGWVVFPVRPIVKLGETGLLMVTMGEAVIVFF